MKYILLSIFAASLFANAALAQTVPPFGPGTLPTEATWNGYFASKQDALGFVPLSSSSNLSDLADAETARTNLGLGGGVSCAANSVSLTTLVVTNGVVTHC